MQKSTSRLRENLLALMEQHGWSQSELSRRSKVTQSTISRIINAVGRGPEWSTIEALAHALGVDPGELASGTPALESDAEIEVGLVDPGALLRAYISSRWFSLDQPNAEELRWLEQHPDVAWTGSAEPGPSLLHALLKRKRSQEQ